MRTWFIVAALALASISPGSANSGPELPSTQFLFTRTPKYVSLAWLRGGERFPFGARLEVLANGKITRLVKGFAASADADISFDGTRVLFAGKRQARDHWQIWELSQAGQKVRQVTNCDSDCVRPFYLPEDRVVYSRRTEQRFVIEGRGLRGGPALALTYFPGSALATDVLRDGRILFEAAYPLSAGTQPELYTVYSDGSGVESYRCDHRKARRAGRQIASSDIVFATTRRLGKFTSALAHEVHISVPEGDYAGDVVEVSPAEWIVSRRQTSGGGHFSLEKWLTADWRSIPLLSDHNADLIQPVLIRERAVPNRHPSGLHDWNYANLLCLNAYMSKYKFLQGSIASVRLYRRDRLGNPELLGSAPVEKDGSFYLRAPADQPIKIALLDAAGKTLKQEAGWFWLRRGEQRVCVGCHAGPETSPENAVPMVLQRSTVAIDLSGSSRQVAGGTR